MLNLETIAAVLATVHVTGWVFFGVLTTQSLPAEEARRHPVLVLITAVVCGFLWPILAYKDLTGRTDR